MKQEKSAARLSSGKKAFSLALAVLLVLGCSLGASLAWLTSTTNEVTNTFTVGNVAITLDEAKVNEQGQFLKEVTNNDAKSFEVTTDIKNAARVQSNKYKLIPGKNYPKDPRITVKAGSEKCWLFVAVTETNNTLGDNGQAVKFQVNDSDGAWNGVSELGNDNYTKKDNVSVYYTIVDASTASQDIYVLKKADNECNDANHATGCVTVASEIGSTWTGTPTLTFNAAAIQYDGLETNKYEGTDAELDAAKAAFWQLPQAFIEICCNKNASKSES